jgi:hypothetical protein
VGAGVRQYGLPATEENLVSYYLKTEREAPAAEIDEETAKTILSRGRHEGRRIVEVFLLHTDGRIDRCQERARRRLGSNAVISRTWLCETYQPNHPDAWGNDRYVPNPEEAIHDLPQPPEAVVLVLLGAETNPESTVQQLETLHVPR